MARAMRTSIGTTGARMALVALVAGLLAPGAHAQPTRDTLRVRLNADIRSTDPGINRDVNTDAVVAHLVEGLVAFREDTSVGPLLAQKVETSADGLTYTFTLRPGLKFQNGAPITSDDVVFAWQRYMTPANNWRCLSEFDGRGYAKVVKVEAKDPLTVVYTLDKPSALFLKTMARPDCGGTGIYHRSAIGHDGKWRELVGSGPYRLTDWKRGQYLELQRNPYYQPLPGKRDGNTGNKTPEIAKVRFMVIPDPSSAKAALLSGNIDVIPDVEDNDLPEYRARKDLLLDSTPTMSQAGLLFQTRDPVLKDARIRRAIALTIDVPELVDAVTGGNSTASRSVIPRPSPFYGKAQAVMPGRDIAAARKLLNEAGYRGQTIKILTTKRYNALFDIAVLTQAMAAEAGLRIDVEVLDWATLLDRYTRGDYQAMAFSYSARLDPSLSYEMITGPKDKQPRKVWETPDAIRLLNESMHESDPTRRQATFDALEARMREDVPAIFVYSETRTSAVRNDVRNFHGWPLGQPRAWGVTFANANASANANAK
ncbi:ABC transporter substrate-binding protein [Cupriavidus plantarum]|uniref:ABC transporter substrate-binding protein n=1 Tax=Cupriavidus plantarum TaxID=942865 RepID=UPI000F17C32D|nr:ABC transporter substrate-binding protein [Cupriavidus plantarum]RLK33574.1 peptide/nickel transport system substrate-binding protein [Cupriavidus plantarum]